MDWISTKNDRPVNCGVYWVWAKVRKKKKWGAYKLYYNGDSFYYDNALENNLGPKRIGWTRIKCWSDKEECPHGVPEQNDVAITENQETFKRIEHIGDAIIPGILAQYYISENYPLYVIRPLISKGTSNYIMGLAAKSANVNTSLVPDGIVDNKYYGSAFEYNVGLLLETIDYDAAYDYVIKYLVPIIRANVPLDKLNVKKSAIVDLEKFIEKTQT